MDRAVIRFNYLAATPRMPRAALFAGLAVDARVRGPILLLLATAVLTVLTATMQLARLRAAQDAYDRAALQVTAQAPAVAATVALRARIIRETQLLELVDATARTSASRADELAWIGNRLPAQTWLHSLRLENGVYSLEGTASRASAIAAAMLALRDSQRATVPQLVSLHDDGADSAAGVRYTLRIAVRQ